MSNATTEPNVRSQLGKVFDRTIQAIHGKPDVINTKASTVRSMTPIHELPQTFIVQTYRQAEVGDFCFVEYIDGEGSVRIVLPPQVMDAIARQRDSLTDKNRKVAGQRRAAADKAAGRVPGFQRAKPKKATPTN